MALVLVAVRIRKLLLPESTRPPDKPTAEILTELLRFNSPLIRRMVWPDKLVANSIVEPDGAEANVWRKDPAPLSLVFSTWNTAAGDGRATMRRISARTRFFIVFENRTGPNDPSFEDPDLARSANVGDESRRVEHGFCSLLLQERSTKMMVLGPTVFVGNAYDLSLARQG